MALQGYGVDTWCMNGLQTGRFARGSQLVAQALYRRLITPRGTLRGGPEEENYGIDLAEYCGRAGDPTTVAMVPTIVRGELAKDDRVEEISCTSSVIETEPGLLSLLLTVTVRLVDEDETFEFTVGIDDVTVTFLGVS